jgi:hypothetical protein
MTTSRLTLRHKCIGRREVFKHFGEQVSDGVAIVLQGI